MSSSRIAPYQFQSTHPLRGATIFGWLNEIQPEISIHAPLAGCDYTRNKSHKQQSISIHAPLAGCDTTALKTGYDPILFQSTHPLRGATATLLGGLLGREHFNPRTPCGVRLILHQPRTGQSRFQSTHPLRGATLSQANSAFNASISIHAPLAGCDLATSTL